MNMLESGPHERRDRRRCPFVNVLVIRYSVDGMPGNPDGRARMVAGERGGRREDFRAGAGLDPKDESRPLSRQSID